MQKVFLLILLLLLGWLAKAQQVTLHGQIADATTQVPLSDVIVKWNNQFIICEKNGTFKIRIPAQLLEIKFEKFGYHTYALKIYAATDTSVSITLNPDIQQIKTVEVTAKPIALTSRHREGIIDYEFSGTNLLLLTERFGAKTPKLSMLAPSGDTVFSSLMPQAVRSFYRNCDEHLFVLGKENAFGFASTDTRFDLQQVGTTAVLMGEFADCIASSVSHFYFEKRIGSKKIKGVYFDYYTNNTAVNYFYTPRQSDVLYTFCNSTDKSFARQLVEEESYQLEKMQNGSYSSSFQMEIDRMFAYKILYKEVQADLKVRNDTVYMFAVADSIMEVYTSNGIYIRTMPLRLPAHDFGRYEFLQDYTTREIYVYYTLNGRIKLALIDESTGQIRKFYKLDKLFAQNLKINNGALYYLQKNGADGGVRVLYKEYLR